MQTRAPWSKRTVIDDTWVGEDVAEDWEGIVLVSGEVCPDHEPCIAVVGLELLGGWEFTDFAEGDEFLFAEGDELVVGVLEPLAVIHVGSKDIYVFVARIIEFVAHSLIYRMLARVVGIPHPEEVVEMVMMGHAIVEHSPKFCKTIFAASVAPPEPFAVHLVERSPEDWDVVGLQDFQILCDAIYLFQPHTVHIGLLIEEFAPLFGSKLALCLLLEVYDSFVKRTCGVP